MAGRERHPSWPLGRCDWSPRLSRGLGRTAIIVVVALAAGACSDRGSVASIDTSATPIPSTTVASASSSVPVVPGTEVVSSDAPMALAITWSPSARWPDGSRPSAADLECTRRAALESSDPVLRRRYASLAAIRDDVTSGATIAEFASVDAGYRRLFDDLVHGVNGNCEPGSGPLSVDGSATVSVTDSAATPGIPDALTSGAVAMEIGQPRVVPQLSSIAEPSSIATSPAVPGAMVSIVFSRNGPLADDALRRAVWLSVDRSTVWQEALTPLAAASTPAVCGPWPSSSPLCVGAAFANTFDADGAARLLNDAGWNRGADGYWAKGGQVPQFAFVIPADDDLAADLQTSLAPRLAAAGFDVRVGVCTARCLDDEAAEFDITVATGETGGDPDIDALVGCAMDDQARGLGPCDPSVAAGLAETRATFDPALRVPASARLAQSLADGSLLLPLGPQPRAVAWRTDVVTRAPVAEASLSLADLVAAATQVSLRSAQGELTAAVDRSGWCNAPWWRCPGSIADEIPVGAHGQSVWLASSTGPRYSPPIDREPRLTIGPLG